MTFEALRQMLRQLGRDPLSVVYAKYDNPADAARAPIEHWVIWEHDASTEEAACDFLAEVLRAPRIVHEETDDERARSKAITAAHRARLQARLAESADERD